MMDLISMTPLLADDSPLDDCARAVVQDLVRREMQSNDDLLGDKLRDPEHLQRVAGRLGVAASHLIDELRNPERRRRVEEVSWKEIQEQPQAIQTTLEQERKAIADAAAYFAGKQIERVYMVGCGDSWFSLVGVRAFFEQLLGIPCEPMQALDFAYYHHQPINEHTLVISLSSSGVVPRTVEAMLVAQALGAYSLALSNTAGSPLMENAEQSILVHAVRVGWPTQSSTAAMAVLYQLGIDLAREKDVSAARLDRLERALYATPQQIASVLEEVNDGIVAVAEAEARRCMYLFAGGGPALACALIGAAKVREMTSDHAYATPLEEYHHYHTQKAGDPLFLIAPTGPSVPRAVQAAQRGQRWGGQVYGVTTKGERRLAPHLDKAFELPQMDELLIAIVYTVPVQLFAYHLAVAKFRLADVGDRG